MKQQPGQINVFQKGLLVGSIGLNGNAKQRRAGKRRLRAAGYSVSPTFGHEMTN